MSVNGAVYNSEDDIPFETFENMKETGKLKDYGIVAIYKNTKDYPDSYVARIWNCETPSPYVMIKKTLEEIRRCLPKGLVGLNPGLGDDPVLVEVYL